MDNSIDKLKDLIDKRISRGKNSGIEIFIIWGVIVLAGYLVNIFLYRSGLVIAIMLLIGAAVQTLYVRIKVKTSGFVILWKKDLNYLWIFTVAVIIIAGVVFPGIVKIYPEDTGTALSLFFIAPAMFITGLLLEKRSVMIGSAVFIIAAIFISLPFPQYRSIVIISAIILGTIAPGIAGKISDRSSQKADSK